MTNNFNLALLESLGAINPIFSQFFQRMSVDNYNEFINILYRDIDCIIQDIESSRALRQDDGEDRTTIEIVNILNRIGYDCSHDELHGGHTDLAVKIKSFIWLGEAKIHSGYDYLHEGFKQLCTRYSTGGQNQSDGGLLIYLYGADAKTVMDRWLTHLCDQSYAGFKSMPCKNNKLYFFTEHTHETSGLPFRVRHMVILLHHDPKDKSGIASKN